MTIAKTLAAVATIAALAGIPAAAQQAVPPYGAPISLEQAKKVIAAAEAEAQKNDWPVALTVVPSGGFLVAMHRLDNTQLGPIAVAEDKARPRCSSAGPRRPSRTRSAAAASACARSGCAAPRLTRAACRSSST